MDWARKWLVDFSAGKTQLVSFDRSNNTGAIDVKMDGSVLEEKKTFKMLGLTFSSKLNWDSYITSIAITPEVALYIYKSTIRLCMEYCCHVWAGAPSCYLELLEFLEFLEYLELLLTKVDMQDCWSFTYCLCWTLGSKYPA